METQPTSTSSGLPWWAWALIAVTVVGGIVWLVARGNKKKMMRRRMAKARRAIKAGKRGKKSTAASQKRSTKTRKSSKRPTRFKSVGGRMIKIGSKEWMNYIRSRPRKKRAKKAA
jgi:hypothetical protein